MATWNVRTMLRPGKMQEIVNETKRYGYDLVAIQEMRWKGQGKIEKKDYSLFYSGPEERTGQFCTGFIVHGKMKRSVIGFEPITDRICKIRLRGKFRNITVITAHAPIEDADEERKEQFYDQLVQVTEGVPRHDMIIMLGDFNAKVGKEECMRIIAGEYTLHEESNENGFHLGQFATTNGLIIKSTCFDHKRIHKGTWKMPGSSVVNQIDHVLVTVRHASSIIDVKTCRGPNCDSDHYLVKAVVRQKVALGQKRQLTERRKWNLEKLQQPEGKREFQSKMNSTLKATGEVMGIEERWSEVQKSIQHAAQETLGVTRKKRNNWFDVECEEAIERKNTARAKMLQRETRQSKGEYEKCRREANSICKGKKKEMLKKRLESIETQRLQKRTKEFYNEINYFRKGYKPRLSGCNNKEGKLLQNEEEISERWTEYFQELLNREEEEREENERVRQSKQMGPEQLINAPTIKDVENAIGKLNNHRAAGEDGITSELVKNCSKEVLEEIHELILKIWEEESIPEEWTKGIIFPVYKKGNKYQCNNYRGITLLNIIYKVFSNVLLQYLTPYAEEILDEVQCGFRQSRGTVDQIFVVRQTMEKCYEHNTDLHMLFVDFRQAFDSINKEKLYEYMDVMGIPQKLVRMIRITLKDVRAKVMVDGRIGNEFALYRGVRQGDALSATLFNLAINQVLQNIRDTGNIVSKSKQISAYADDVVLTARNRRYLKEMFLEMEEEGKKIGLEVNDSKTKYMHMTAMEGRRSQENMIVNRHNFENVRSFEYLGTTLTNNNKISEEISRRIMAGNRTYYANIKLFKSRLLSRTTKAKIYKTLVRPVVTYGSEAWNLLANDANKLRTFERKVIRRIYGPIQNQNGWRIRTNDEIQNILNQEDIVRFVKAQRMRWFGHVERMEEKRMPRKVLKTRMEKRRRQGRPRNRWRDEVEADLVTMNIRPWRSAAQDRSRWRKIVEEAKAHTGL